MFSNNTDTAAEFADVIEGNYTAILDNNTNIRNTNNTSADNTDIDIRKDRMKLPNQSEVDCPNYL
jgi:hypothetical protein